MATGEVMGTTSCECGGTVTWKESKSGGASGACSSCGEQRFKRSPKSVDALRGALGKPADKSAEKPAESGGWLDKL